MDRPGRNQEEENIQLKIYSDQNTHGMAATFIIIALVFAGLMFSDISGIKTELGVIESVVLWGAPVISFGNNTGYVCCVLQSTGDEQRRMQGEFLENTSIL